MRIATKLLSHEDTIALIKEYQEGNEQALTRLVTANQGMVFKIAWPYTNDKYLSFDVQDLVQEGNIGLIKAIKRFDINRGLQLSSYAHPYIHAYIRRAIENNGKPVCTPVHIQHKFFKAIGKARLYQAKHGVLPTDKLLAKWNRHNTYNKTIVDVRDCMYDAMTKSIINNKDYKAQIIRYSIASNPVEEEVDKLLILSFIRESWLEPMEKEIVISWLGLEYPAMKPGEIAKRFNVKYYIIRDAYHRAIAKLREIW